MASSTITLNTLQQNPLFTISHCKYPNTFKFHPSSEFPKKIPPYVVNSKLPTKDHEKTSTKTLNSPTLNKNGGGFKSKRAESERNSTVEAIFSSIARDKNGTKNVREKEKRNPFVKKQTNDATSGKSQVEKKVKVEKGHKIESPELRVRVNLDMCSKRGDVKGAIEIYEKAQREGMVFGQYHYTVILYLCSSAAVGVVKPNKSGSGNRTLNALELSGSIGLNSVDLDNEEENKSDKEIMFSEEFKNYALEKGFEIYNRMCLDKVPMNEATLTSVAKMAMSMGNGDMAFDMVEQMKPLGINPRLRSYGPALSTFCNSGDVDKAFAVESHMLEHGVYPEEPELQALLRVSIEARKGDQVYYLLQKLRTSVRKVLPSTAEIICNWFESEASLNVGKTKWDKKQIKEAIENGGGGWHGQGWLGKGKWKVRRSVVGSDAVCKCCGEKLSMIDLDPRETENFADSVASIALKREKNSSFQNFQKWLDYYGPFEAVIDGANVGLFSQTRFMPSKVNAIANAIRQKLPSKKWPLIVLHNRRITGHKMDQPINKPFVEKWKNADALYATPTGSNDDWYWLYAAIKFKCLLVTNDEMRDHTFQLLGNDFFPKWKERHQVRFSFSETGPVFHMPPPCSIVIQESENGHWHIPIASEDSEQDHDSERTWLCVTRPKSARKRKTVVDRPEDHNEEHTRLAAQSKSKIKPQQLNGSNSANTPNPSKDYKNLKKMNFLLEFRHCRGYAKLNSCSEQQATSSFLLGRFYKAGGSQIQKPTYLLMA
ncbi:hypothetical protein ACFE04_014650 [Oxalis oulophora]